MNQRVRYTVNDVSNSRFYQMPKFLFEGELKALSLSAKVLYSLLRDRHDLSLQNQWINENNEVYLIYTRKNMEDMLGLADKTVKKAIEELKSFGLIEEEHMGLNKANRIYLTSVDIENTGIVKTTTPEQEDLRVRNRNIYGSRTEVFTGQEPKILRPNDTNINKTDSSDTDISQSVSEEVDGRTDNVMENITFFPLGQNTQVCKNSVQEENSKNELSGIDRIEELIKETKRAKSKTLNHQSVENVEGNQEESANPNEWEKKKNQQYETADPSSSIFINFSELNKSHPHETDLIGEIEINIMDMLNSSSIIVSGVRKDNKIVSKTLKKLTYWHLEEILRKVQENKTELKNPKRWLQSLIFNQALEKEVSMQSKVNAMLHK